MSDLQPDAIRWDLETVRRTHRFDLLACTQDELFDAACTALEDRDSYRLLASQALAALRDVTSERDRLRWRLREQTDQIRALMRIDAPAARGRRAA